jgi:predicted DNA repair protein MutK
VSTGLIALLDDVVGLAKIAAASLDDVAGQAAKAGAKAAGIVIDDAAVTPRYVVGFAAERELPIVGRIALGSLKNKLLYLLPAALVLSLAAPWAITPLLMLGGGFLCYEGAEKVYHALRPHQAERHEAALAPAAPDGRALEDQKVGSAIKTDFILSAEIMALTLSTLPQASTWMQAAILAVVGLGITAVVYGGVALIVKADDVGLALAQGARPATALFATKDAAPSGADRALRPLTQALGRGLVLGMPYFLKLLGIVGTAAMVWVGGGIIIHGLEAFGLPWLGHAVHDASEAAARALPALAGAVSWIVTAAASGLVGLVVGAVLIPCVQYGLAPLLRWWKGRNGRAVQPGH